MPITLPLPNVSIKKLPNFVSRLSNKMELVTLSFCSEALNGRELI